MIKMPVLHRKNAARSARNSDRLPLATTANLAWRKTRIEI